MRSQALEELGLGLLGVYVLVQALLLVSVLSPVVSVWVETRQIGTALIAVGLPFCLLLAMGCLLVMQPGAVARGLLGWSDTNDRTHLSGDISLLLVAMVGVLVFTGAVPGLLRWIPYVSPTAGLPSTGGGWRALVPGAAQALLGLLLFFQPGAVLAFWERHRGGMEAIKETGTGDTAS